jgi:uncharacterized protein YndB with AHSA1/START domain
MAVRSNSAAESVETEFSITRVFDAPRALVWKAFTEPERLEQWWGPRGFTTRVLKLELRPTGVFLYSQRMPDGREMFGKWVYREIVAPERLVIVNSFCDEKEHPVRHPFNPNWPLEMLCSSTFTEHQGRTTLTIRAIPINATEAERKVFEDGQKFMGEGFTGTLDQLAEYLAKAQS